MTTIKAEIIEDSVNPDGKRITTMLCTYPLVIHAEVMTHRVFSRNAASSRAIPAARLIDDVRKDPFVPLHWGKNEPGMQARAQLEGDDLTDCQFAWNEAIGEAIRSAEMLAQCGAHKQLVNRVLAPFAHIRTLITSTEWDNFFKLRCHPDAEPHMEMLANAMRDARNAAGSTPRESGEWHLPFVTQEERDAGLHGWDAIHVSAARCARVSYRTHDGRLTTPEEDKALAAKLMAAGHWSPFEHVATVSPGDPEGYANFRGWVSARAYLEEYPGA